MVVTSEILPAPEIAPFVRCYTYRTFDTGAAVLVKPWHAAHELQLVFFLNATPFLHDTATPGKNIKGSFGDIVGLSAHHLGEMHFQGHYRCFSIQFTPNGFYKIFGVPASQVTNQIIRSDAVLGPAAASLFEQLAQARTINELVAHTNSFLLRHIRQQPTRYQDTISLASHAIMSQPGLCTIKELAATAHMSLRNFERHFQEQVGLPPKLFCRISRFNCAMQTKISHPHKTWSAIAMDCGYFDQMHLIRDFKEFAGNSPLHFFKQTPLPEEHYTSRVGA